jgi:hypothetical protein
MPSSTSSSDHEPVFDRPVPPVRWAHVAFAAAALAVVALGGWEAFWRAEGVRPAYGNHDGQWAEARRRLDRSEPNATAFIGSSRTMFAIDLDVWEEETGVRAVQLALEGSNPLPVLTDIADDEDFRGLLIVGVTPPLVMMPDMGARAAALQRYHEETPAQWMGQKLSYPLERTFAFYSFDFALFTVLDRQPWWPSRPGLPDPPPEVRRFEDMSRDREADLWTRVDDDPEFRAIVTDGWQGILDNLPPPPPEDVARQAFEAKLESIARDVAKIRARGGEVAFIRPPSSDVFREFERRATPRERVWEPIVAAAGAVGVHAEDYPELSDVPTPEWSHISSRDKARWTRALVGILRERLAERGARRPELGGTEP